LIVDRLKSLTRTRMSLKTNKYSEGRKDVIQYQKRSLKCIKRK